MANKPNILTILVEADSMQNRIRRAAEANNPLENLSVISSSIRQHQYCKRPIFDAQKEILRRFG
jgi:hypothetical protein